MSGMQPMDSNVGDASLGSGPSEPANWRRDLALLALVFGLLLFADLGDTALANPDEGRYAEIPREMVAGDDYVTPRLNGVVYFEKPPLVYWAVAGMLRVFGPAEWAMRAPVALFALAGILLTYAAGRRLHGRNAGLTAAAVLGTSLLYFILSRILLLDMAMAVLMTATLFCFILGVRESPGPRRRWFFYGLYASAALATLTKGLIGFLLPGAVMFLWLLIFNQWRRLRPLHLPSGVLLFLAIAAPWHVLVAQRNPEWASFYFVREHWERFTTTTHERTAPWWFFGPILLVGLFPWTGCLWGALRHGLAGGQFDGLPPSPSLRRVGRAGPFGRLRACWARRRENADAWFLVTWAAFVILFFSKSQSKLIPYILPMFPPLAVLIGAWLAGVWREGAGQRLRGAMRVHGVMASALGTALLVALYKPGIIRDPAQAEALRPGGITAALLLILGAFLVPWLFSRGRRQAGLIALAVSVGGFQLMLGILQDKISRPGTKELALHVNAHARPEDRIYHYYEFFHDFTFYTGRFVGTVDWIGELEVDIDPVAQTSGRFIDRRTMLEQWNQPGRIFVVARKRHVVATPESIAAAEREGEPMPLFGLPEFRYHLLAESPGHYLFSNQP